MTKKTSRIEYRTEEDQRLHPWSLEVKLEEKPLSANKMFTIKRHRTHAYNKYAKRWREALEGLTLPEDIEDHSKMAFIAEIEVGLSTKNADLDNCIKPLIDCWQENLGFNDKNIIHIIATRYVASRGKEWVSMKLQQTFRELNQ